MLAHFDLSAFFIFWFFFFLILPLSIFVAKSVAIRLILSSRSATFDSAIDSAINFTLNISAFTKVIWLKQLGYISAFGLLLFESWALAILKKTDKFDHFSISSWFFITVHAGINSMKYKSPSFCLAWLIFWIIESKNKIRSHWMTSLTSRLSISILYTSVITRIIHSKFSSSGIQKAATVRFWSQSDIKEYYGQIQLI